MSEVKANKISPATSTVVTLGDSSDTFVVTTGAKIDINGTELILDADADTSITADTDDQIDIRIAGADDFRFTANNFNVLSGSTLTIDSGATVTNSGTATGFLPSKLEATGDTSAGDNAALGYTAALGAILTGQGSTNDVTLVNDADATVLSIPTGTTNVDIVGTAEAAGLSLNSAKLQSVVLEISNDSGTIKHRWLSPNLGVTELGNWGEKFLNASTTNTTTPTGTNSSTAFANGAKLSSANASHIIIDMAAQTSANALISSIIIFNNNTGTAGLLGGWAMESVNVNGTTSRRLQILMYDSSQAAFNINTTNVASGKAIKILITGWFA